MWTVNTFALWAKAAPIWFYLFGPALFFLSIFLIFLILIQRGRGGGLSGAFGGAGGQSAFGHKTGDIFTWITVVTTTLWFLLSMLAIGCLQDRRKLDLSTGPALRTPKGADKSGAGASAADKAPSKGASEAPSDDGSGTSPADKKGADGGGASLSAPSSNEKPPEKKSP